MKNPVNIANMVGSGWGGDGSRASAAPATLNVIARIKVGGGWGGAVGPAQEEQQCGCG